MAIEINSESNKLLAAVTDKLTKHDYNLFVPAAEQLIEEHGKIRVLSVMRRFRGWTAAALWEDLKFAMKHFNHYERLAIVGDSKWTHAMSLSCRFFTAASLKYFDISQLEQAHEWIDSNQPVSTKGIRDD